MQELSSVDQEEVSKETWEATGISQTLTWTQDYEGQPDILLVSVN